MGAKEVGQEQGSQPVRRYRVPLVSNDDPTRRLDLEHNCRRTGAASPPQQDQRRTDGTSREWSPSTHHARIASPSQSVAPLVESAVFQPSESSFSSLAAIDSITVGSPNAVARPSAPKLPAYFSNARVMVSCCSSALSRCHLIATSSSNVSIGIATNDPARVPSIPP